MKFAAVIAVIAAFVGFVAAQQVAVIAAVAAVVSLVTAQQVELPQCAYSCVSQFTTGNSVGGCNSIDIKCICSNSVFLDSISCCLAGVCVAPGDIDKAVAYAKNICTGAGVTVPDKVICKAGANGTTPTNSSSTTPPSPGTSPGKPSTSATFAPAGLLVSLVGGIVAVLLAF